MSKRSIKIHTENFKSLRDFNIDIQQFNVLIGPNGSGKTNVLEMFKFASLCIAPNRFPTYPFAPWWGFGNVVWSGDVAIPIRMKIKTKLGKYDLTYDMSISGSSGSHEFLEESLRIDGYMNVKRGPDGAEYKIDDNFLKTAKKKLKEDTPPHFKIGFRLTSDSAWQRKLSKSKSFLATNAQYRMNYSKQIGTYMMDFDATDGTHMSEIPFPLIGRSRSDETPIFDWIPRLLSADSLILLRQLNYNVLRQPPSANRPAMLEEDGNGLINILFRWYNRKNDLPSRFARALEELFPGWQIRFTPTDDGRILLNVYDGNTLLSPPSIPDGFYKMLAILAAIEMKPKLLLIDEVDASLHAKMIVHMLDELQTCDANVIVTTHSPIVIDAVNPENLILIERSGCETKCRRIKNPKVLKTKLDNIGLTISEGWLYAKI